MLKIAAEPRRHILLLVYRGAVVHIVTQFYAFTCWVEETVVTNVLLPDEMQCFFTNLSGT